MSKVCTTCQLEQAIGEFSRRAAAPDGYSGQCKSCCASAKALSYQANKAGVRKQRVAYKYGVTWEFIEDLHNSQAGKCAICGTVITLEVGDQAQTAHVDHCHVTNRVRGLLCNTCNRGVGLLKDNPYVLRAAAAYLEQP